MQHAILNCKKSKDLEKLYLKFFLGNKKKELKKLKNEFYCQDEISEYKRPYSQAYFNFNHKKYYTSCILLTALLEGLIRKYAELTKEDKNISGQINKKLNNKYNNKDMLIFQDKTGLCKFLEKYYSSMKNRKINKDNYLNRNVLMHGIEFDKYREIDAIKLFNVIDIINSLLLN